VHWARRAGSEPLLPQDSTISGATFPPAPASSKVFNDAEGKAGTLFCKAGELGPHRPDGRHAGPGGGNCRA